MELIGIEYSVMKKKSPSIKSIPASEYTSEYYQSSCDGYLEFNESKGQVIPIRLIIPLEIAGIKPGDRILDIGCGRGEILYHSAMAGATAFGFDYSPAAVKITIDNLQKNAPDLQMNILINIGDAQHIPFKSNSIDIVFMLDVVEHLTTAELSKAYQEVWRVMKTGGRLIIHTMPNLWYYRYIYPMYRIVQKLRGIMLPKNPRDRWPFIHVHVNEQTPISLYRGLRKIGFDTRVWLTSTQTYEKYQVNNAMRLGMEFFTKSFPFRYFFCNDIFAVATKITK